jgi:hypothetical protein
LKGSPVEAMKVVCHDRKDYSESTGLYPCNDGTQKERWQDCKDATKSNNDKY